MRSSLQFLKAMLKNKSRRRVVYTCMFGYSERFADINYAADDTTDYVCFTDDPSLKSARWKFHYVDSKPLGPVKTSKFIKILAHRFLAQYDVSLYLDNTVILKVPAAYIFSMLQENAMMCFRHPWRDCIYLEAEAVIDAQYDDPSLISLQMDIYREQGYPLRAGLLAGSMLLRRHGDTQIIRTMETWFDEVRQYSYRDQLSFNYAAWKTGLKPEFFDEQLDDNQLMNWPVTNGPRLPRGFRDQVYYQLNPDVARSGMDARQHYMLYGQGEGRAWAEK